MVFDGAFPQCSPRLPVGNNVRGLTGPPLHGGCGEQLGNTCVLEPSVSPGNWWKLTGHQTLEPQGQRCSHPAVDYLAKNVGLSAQRRMKLGDHSAVLGLLQVETGQAY
ncbi:unnamed protein product [Arctogadus glacialis]